MWLQPPHLGALVLRRVLDWFSRLQSSLVRGFVWGQGKLVASIQKIRFPVKHGRAASPSAVEDLAAPPPHKADARVGKPQPAAGAAALSQSQGLLAASRGFTPLSPTPASRSSMGLTFSRWGPGNSSVESFLPWFLHYGHFQLSTWNAKLCSQSPRHSFLNLDYDLGNLCFVSSVENNYPNYCRMIFLYTFCNRANKKETQDNKMCWHAEDLA